jgi:hypothetical protein
VNNDGPFSVGGPTLLIWPYGQNSLRPAHADAGARPDTVVGGVGTAEVGAIDRARLRSRKLTVDVGRR